MCVFRKGVRGATRPPGSPSEGGGEGERERKEREAGKGEVAGIRERLPHGPRLLQRKKIDMHDSRTRERAKEGWRGASGALLLGEQNDGERERVPKKVVRRRERTTGGKVKGNGPRSPSQRTSLDRLVFSKWGDEPPGVRQ